MSEENIGATLKSLRKKAGLTLEEVGNAVGVGKSTVRKWETGAIANMRRDKIQALADVLSTTPLHILNVNQDTNSCPPSDYEQYGFMEVKPQRIPLLGDIACGAPILAIEELQTYVEIGNEVKADFCLRAKGDSMIGARIFDGDLVFIRKQDMVENGEIAVVIIDDEATLKRVQFDKSSGTMCLIAENPQYKMICIMGEELNNVRILGKAVTFYSAIR